MNLGPVWQCFLDVFLALKILKCFYKIKKNVFDNILKNTYKNFKKHLKCFLEKRLRGVSLKKILQFFLYIPKIHFLAILRFPLTLVFLLSLLFLFHFIFIKIIFELF